MSKRDKLYQNTTESVAPFEFNKAVVDVFDDMVSRSVPTYSLTQDLSVIAARYLNAKDVLDIGCSTGTSIINLYKSLPNQIRHIVGIDASDAMITACRDNLNRTYPAKSWELISGDARTIEFPKSDLVLLTLILQFLPQSDRPYLLSRIVECLSPRGGAIIAEKVVDSEILRELHEDYKQLKGYSITEIQRKKEALEDVLRPLSLEDNVKMLKDAGFKSVSVVLKAFNFVTFFATKS